MEEMKSSIDYLSNQLGNFEKLNESISDISQQLVSCLTNKENHE